MYDFSSYIRIFLEPSSPSTPTARETHCFEGFQRCKRTPHAPKRFRLLWQRWQTRKNAGSRRHFWLTVFLDWGALYGPLHRRHCCHHRCCCRHRCRCYHHHSHCYRRCHNRHRCYRRHHRYRHRYRYRRRFEGQFFLKNSARHRASVDEKKIACVVVRFLFSCTDAQCRVPIFFFKFT